MMQEIWEAVEPQSEHADLGVPCALRLTCRLMVSTSPVRHAQTNVSDTATRSVDTRAAWGSPVSSRWKPGEAGEDEAAPTVRRSVLRATAPKGSGHSRVAPFGLPYSFRQK